jgi:hypothetical protein
MMATLMLEGRLGPVQREYWPVLVCHRLLALAATRKIDGNDDFLKQKKTRATYAVSSLLESII